MDRQLEKTLANLSSRGFVASYFATSSEAAAFVLGSISKGETVGIGGSVTVRQLGLYDALKARGNAVLWHWFDKDRDVRRETLLSDVYLCSANALMDSGELVSIDGGGNRVAAMFFGPKRCFVICGVNKLVGSYDEAIARIKTVACPQNARRLNMDTPCAKTGKCAECGAGLRMCRITVRYSYPLGDRETHVVIVGEELGF